jgi:hypothetical protein
MSFAAKEESRYQGRPCNLFLIRYGEGPNSYYAYTDAAKKLIVDGITYLPVSIQRGNIVVKGSMDKAALEVRMSLSLDVAELFRVYPPAQVVSLTISQGHLSDPDAQFLVIWSGRIIAAKREPPELILTCEPIRTSMKRLGLRRHYQFSCPHVLFGEWCRASKAAATSNAIVSSISGTKLTLVPGWALRPTSEYLGGMVEWENEVGDLEVRTIIRVATNVVTLSGSLRGIAGGTNLRMIRGCSRDILGCESHNNILNFGGCPYIPMKNPVGRANQFY